MILVYEVFTYQDEQDQWCITENKPNQHKKIKLKNSFQPVHDMDNKKLVFQYQRILLKLEKQRNLTQIYSDQLRKNKCGTWAVMLDCTIDLSDLVKELVELQLIQLQHSFNDIRKNDVWEES